MERSSRRTPRRSSRRATRRLTRDLGTPSTRAAAEKLRCPTTAAKDWRSLRSCIVAWLVPQLAVPHGLAAKKLPVWEDRRARRMKASVPVRSRPASSGPWSRCEDRDDAPLQARVPREGEDRGAPAEGDSGASSGDRRKGALALRITKDLLRETVLDLRVARHWDRIAGARVDVIRVPATLTDEQGPQFGETPDEFFALHVPVKG